MSEKCVSILIICEKIIELIPSTQSVTFVYIFLFLISHILGNIERKIAVSYFESSKSYSETALMCRLI